MITKLILSVNKINSTCCLRGLSNTISCSMCYLYFIAAWKRVSQPGQSLVSDLPILKVDRFCCFEIPNTPTLKPLIGFLCFLLFCVKYNQKPRLISTSLVMTTCYHDHQAYPASQSAQFNPLPQRIIQYKLWFNTLFIFHHSLKKC